MRYELRKKGEAQRWMETSDGVVRSSDIGHLVTWKIAAVLHWADACGYKVYVVSAPGSARRIRMEAP